MKQVDTLIVGFGLAGLAYAETLRQHHQSFHIIDQAKGGSSVIAAGIYNPTVLKRFNMTWKGEEFHTAALPFYSITTFAIRCFYAGKNMKLPVRISIHILILNTIFSLIFMNFLGVHGLALANLLSAILHTVFALQALKENYMISFIKGLKHIFLPILVGLFAITAICILGKIGLSYFDFTHKVNAFISVFSLIPISVGCYFGVLRIFKISDLSFVKS